MGLILAIAICKEADGFRVPLRQSVFSRSSVAQWIDTSRPSSLNGYDRGSLRVFSAQQRRVGMKSHQDPNSHWTGITNISKTAGRLLIICISVALAFFRRGGKATFASGDSFAAKQTFQSGKSAPLQGMLIWCLLFVLSATMHSAEAAMTKISPFRAREIAEEEGKGSPFQTLSTNLTQLLSTILITTTTLSIYSTALFIQTVSKTFPTLSLPFVTALLAMITLFFGELLPKAIAVSNSELVARKTVKSISRLATILYPVTVAFKKSSDFVLRLVGCVA